MEKEDSFSKYYGHASCCVLLNCQIQNSGMTMILYTVLRFSYIVVLFHKILNKLFSSRFNSCIFLAQSFNAVSFLTYHPS